MVEIRKYQNERETLVKLIEELEDYLAQMDPLKRLRRLLEYGEIYADDLLKKIAHYRGVIYLAETENTIVGMIAGIVEEPTKIDKAESHFLKSARILELIVHEKYRGKNIGSLLMNTIEEYFEKQGCDSVRVEVFVPNKSTHLFYQKHHYQDRVIDMIKVFPTKPLGESPA